MNSPAHIRCQHQQTLVCETQCEWLTGTVHGKEYEEIMGICVVVHLHNIINMNFNTKIWKLPGLSWWAVPALLWEQSPRIWTLDPPPDAAPGQAVLHAPPLQDKHDKEEVVNKQMSTKWMTHRVSRCICTCRYALAPLPFKACNHLLLCALLLLLLLLQLHHPLHQDLHLHRAVNQLEKTKI